MSNVTFERGSARQVSDPDDKLRALGTVVEALLPGRLAEVCRPTRKELGPDPVRNREAPWCDRCLAFD